MFSSVDKRLKALAEFVKHHRVSSLFAVLSLVVGVYFVFVTPLFWGTDEVAHVARVYQFNKGQLFSEKLQHNRQEAGYGGHIPENLYAIVLNVTRDQIDNATTGSPVIGMRNVDDPSIYKELGERKLENGKYVVWGFPNTAAYSPVAYIPAIIGMRIADAIGANIYTMLILMRLCNLVCFVAIIYAALRILERTQLKWIVFALALMPMSLFEGTLVAADTLTIAMVILFSAIALKALLYGKKIRLTTGEMITLGISTVAIPLLKPGYFPLIGLLLCIPAYATSLKRTQVWTAKIGTIVVGMALFLLWTYVTRDITNSAALIRPGDDWQLVNSTQQLHAILGRPFGYLVVLARTLLLEDTKYVYEMLGSLGLNFVRVPGLAIIATITSLLLAIGVMEKVYLSWWYKIGIFGMSLVVIGIIFSGMYLTFTNVNGPVVMGVQGRYLLPVLPLLFGGIVACIKVRVTPSFVVPAERMIIVAVMISLVTAAMKYTYVTWG